MIDVRTRRTFRRLLPYLTTRTLLLLSLTGAPTTSQNLLIRCVDFRYRSPRDPAEFRAIIGLLD